MPDPFQYSMALLAALVITVIASLGLLRLCTMRATTMSLARFVFVPAILCGLLSGYRVLDFEWPWPPGNALSRFLTLLLPSALLIELLAAGVNGFPAGNSKPGGLRWAQRAGSGLRLVLFATAGRVLWHDSVYLQPLSDSVAENGVRWLPLLILSFGILAIYGAWISLKQLASRGIASSLEPGSLVASLSMSILTTGLATMLAGYIKGGAASLPLGGSLAAAALILSWPVRRPSKVAADDAGVHAAIQMSTSLIGIGVMALFCLLWIGRFFGQLSTLDVALLFLAPQCCWVSEFARISNCSVRLRCAIRLLAVSVPLAIVIYFRWQQFAQKMEPLIADLAL
jgi:hypothetical protein